MLSEVVHVDVSVCLHPVFVGFDGERPDEAQEALGVGKDAHDVGSAPDLLVEAFEHVGGLQVLVVPARQPEEGQRALDVLLGPCGDPRIAGRPFGEPCGEIGLGLGEIAPVVEPA